MSSVGVCPAGHSTIQAAVLTYNRGRPPTHLVHKAHNGRLVPAQCGTCMKHEMNNLFTECVQSTLHRDGLAANSTLLPSYSTCYMRLSVQYALMYPCHSH